LRGIMQEHGYAIVTDVLTPQECSELTVCLHAAVSSRLTCHQASFTRDMAAVAPADASDLETALRAHAMPGHFQRSFCTHLGLMHGELSWRCRLHPNVRRVYAALHPSHELVTGLDNVFFTQVPQPCSAELQHASCSTGLLRCGGEQPSLGARGPEQARGWQRRLGRLSGHCLRVAVAALGRFPRFIHHRASAEIASRRVRAVPHSFTVFL
jgi:hypothetical protein